MAPHIFTNSYGHYHLDRDTVSYGFESIWSLQPRLSVDLVSGVLMYHILSVYHTVLFSPRITNLRPHDLIDKVAK